MRLDPESTSTQPREAFKTPLTGPEMLKRLEAKRKATVEKEEQAKKKKAESVAQNDAKRDAARDIIERLNADQTILVSKLSSGDLGLLLQFFNKKAYQLNEQKRIDELKVILQAQWSTSPETANIRPRQRAITMTQDGELTTVFTPTDAF